MANKMKVIDYILMEANDDDFFNTTGIHRSNGNIVYLNINNMDQVVRKPYFFMKQELYEGIEESNYKDMMRHMIISYGGGYYDYIVNKHFDSIFDWVEDCGGTIKDVCFGQNRNWKRENTVFVDLYTLLNFITRYDGWEFWGVEEDEDDLSSITQESDELPPLEPIPSPPVKKIGLLDWYGHLVIIIWLSAVVFAFCSNPKHKTKFSPLKLNSFPNSSF